jgi:hypothetical protein
MSVMGWNTGVKRAWLDAKGGRNRAATAESQGKSYFLMQAITSPESPHPRIAENCCNYAEALYGVRHVLPMMGRREVYQCKFLGLPPWESNRKE